MRCDFLATLALFAVSGCFVVPASSRTAGPPPSAESEPPPAEAPGEPPPQPAVERGGVAPDLVGCWVWYNYKDRRTEDASYRARLELHGDGSYGWRLFPWGSSADKGLPEYNEQGQWGAAHGALQLFPDQRRPYERLISHEDGSLHFDGAKQFHC